MDAFRDAEDSTTNCSGANTDGAIVKLFVRYIRSTGDASKKKKDAIILAPSRFIMPVLFYFGGRENNCIRIMAIELKHRIYKIAIFGAPKKHSDMHVAGIHSNVSHSLNSILYL